MPKELGLPRDSLERRRGGRGGPAPRRDRQEDGKKVAKRMSNDYNAHFKNNVAGVVTKKKGFNPMARAHMGSDAYKGHAKKLKADLIHKAKVKKDYAKVLKQEEENTPEFYKQIFGEKTIDDEGNIVEYNDPNANEEDEEMEDAPSDDDNDDDEEDEEESQYSEGSDSEKEEKSTPKNAEVKKNEKTKPGKQDDGTFKRAAKPNPFKAAIEKREAEKKAIQEARERAQRARADAKKGRDAYYANRNKTTKKIQEKTPRGQPVLANQIKMMLGKIKDDVKENTSRAPANRWGGRGGRKGAGRGLSRGAKKGTSSAHA